MIKTSNEAQEMEIILNRTTTLYDQALTEYRQMFNQWKESVNILQQKNDDIKKIIQVRKKNKKNKYLIIFHFVIAIISIKYIKCFEIIDQ